MAVMSNRHDLSTFNYGIIVEARKIFFSQAILARKYQGYVNSVQTSVSHKNYRHPQMMSEQNC